MEVVKSIIMELDWSPLFISLKTGIIATFLSFFFGIYTAKTNLEASLRHLKYRQYPILPIKKHSIQKKKRHKKSAYIA